MKNKFIAVIGALLAILIAGFFYNKYRVPPKIKFDFFQLTDLDNRPVNLNTFKGKKIFINFFATWCGPCLQEFPSLINAQSILGKGNFQFFFVSDEPISELQSFQKQTDLSLTILHSKKNLREYRIFTLPTSYVLNSKKEIVFAMVGSENWSSDRIIEKIKAISK